MKKSVVVALVVLSAVAAFAASRSGSFRFSPNSVSVTAAVRGTDSRNLVQPVKGGQAGAQAGDLHPCGLLREDPRTIPGFVQVKSIPVAPGHAPADAVLAVDLSGQMPPVGNQGSQGSCTAWATGYYQKTHYEWVEYNWDLTQTSHQFSPAFIYNQINGGIDWGSYIYDALVLIADQGCASMADVPYNMGDCITWPPESAYAHAIPHRGVNPTWFDMSDDAGITMAKQRCDNGYTTVIGIDVYANFDNIQNFNYTYCVADIYGSNRGGHAVTIIGYDDSKVTNDGLGAFKMINSWGTGWGDSGFWWMSYVAVKNSILSQRAGYFVDDLTGYAPTMIGRVQLTHDARDLIGIRLGVGTPTSPLWTKNFRSWRDYTIVDRPFPANNMVFDMTEGEPFVTNGTTDSIFVRTIDDASDGQTGTINYFAGEHLVWNETALSPDPPVNIPDYNTAVYAQAAFPASNGDVGVQLIVAPTGTVDWGATIAPQAWVKNYGSLAATFPVTMHIGSLYTNTQTVNNLAAGDSTPVTFTNWTAGERGLLAVRCSTDLANDQFPDNDTLSGSVTVRVTDVGVSAILAPSGTVDSGSVITPQARVKNFGTAAATFPVTMHIGAGYTNTQTVNNLGAGDSVPVLFTAWVATVPGTFPVRCSTGLGTDQVNTNDTLSGTVTVRTPGDVGVSSILAPTGIVNSGATIVPQAVVQNYDDIALSFPVTFRIGGTSYMNTQNVTDLAPGGSATISFADWTAARRGHFATGCTTGLAGDSVTANNGVADSVTVRVQDIGVFSIVSPAGGNEPGRVVTPAANIRNYGNTPADYEVWMFIFDPTGAQVYLAGTSVTDAAPGTNLLVDAFPTCTLRLTGDWSAKCSTAMVGDVNAANNVITADFAVRALWIEVKSIPEPPSGRPVKDGAWLAYHDATGFIYAGKGNKTGDFFSYDPVAGNWTQLHDIPLGMEAKLPRKGACGVADGSRYLYMAKGNNTLGFWRYDVTSGAWFQLAGVPAGSNKVKAGAAAVYVQDGDVGYVYLLKGGRSEFCRYNTVTYAWEALPAAPMGSKPKWDKGSFLVYDGANTIYAQKGKYQELWAFDLPTQTWGTSSLNGMPFVGRSGRTKKSKDGGSGAWVGGCIYALKGGNTSEFWRYDAAANSWLELDTMPSYGSTGRPRRVNAGGSMCSAAGTLYALKGNKTFEFWRFAPGFVAATQPVPQPAREGVMASSFFVPRSSFLISPNPLATGFVHLAVGGTALSRPALVRVYDAAGRCVGVWKPLLQNGAADLDLRHLATGVYLVKVEADDLSATQRLVVQK